MRSIALHSSIRRCDEAEHRTAKRSLYCESFIVSWENCDRRPTQIRIAERLTAVRVFPSPPLLRYSQSYHSIDDHRYANSSLSSVSPPIWSFHPRAFPIATANQSDRRTVELQVQLHNRRKFSFAPPNLPRLSHKVASAPATKIIRPSASKAVLIKIAYARLDTLARPSNILRNGSDTSLHPSLCAAIAVVLVAARSGQPARYVLFLAAWAFPRAMHCQRITIITALLPLPKPVWRPTSNQSFIRIARFQCNEC